MNLPWLGLGLSSNLGAQDSPNPFALRARAPGAFDFLEYSAPLSLDEARRDAALFGELEGARAELPVVFHPVHLNLYGPSRETDARLAALDAHLRAVGSPWVGNDVGWWHEGGQHFPGYLYLPPPLTEAGLADAAAHALHVQSRLSVPLLLENPATTLAPAAAMHVLEFMAALHRRTGLGLILDLGHLLAHQLSRGLPLDAGFDAFPFEQVLELHLAGGVVTARGARRFYVDDHTQPVREELFELLARVLPRCTRLRALTYEADGHPIPVALATLERLRALAPPKRDAVVEATVQRQRVPELTNASRPWDAFDLAYAGRGAEVDPVGAAMETDFRLAVIAEALDRDFPLTRPLLCPDRASLLAFTASPEFRGLFEGLERALPQVFSAYARHRLREQPSPGLELVFSLETMAHAMVKLAHPPPEPKPGLVSLAVPTAMVSFAADPTELVFAARALRRHLSGRAAGSGLFEASGFAGLRQAADRAPPRPTMVAVRRVDGRLDVAPLSRGSAALLKRAARGFAPGELEEAERSAVAELVEAGLVRLS